eukprot:6188694-Pleurochrysis_carterae.AAC.2
MAVYSCVPHLRHGLFKPVFSFKAAFVCRPCLAFSFDEVCLCRTFRKLHASRYFGTFNSISLNREFSPLMFRPICFWNARFARLLISDSLGGKRRSRRKAQER